jgi:hypothetical protein
VASDISGWLELHRAMHRLGEFEQRGATACLQPGISNHDGHAEVTLAFTGAEESTVITRDCVWLLDASAWNFIIAKPSAGSRPGGIDCLATTPIVEYAHAREPVVV